ncbi:acyltransferase [Accumulibacter sp.]|uniref:acyltransferase family protein n=1 Tax=Accumulibacter sp. TaxID=2053492 RepID=UPI00258A3CA9|nr:acyltransferase [Accumulibacter sp.]MCM8578469.1 acyltransferase [Accumulibacter sp.]
MSYHESADTHGKPPELEHHVLPYDSPRLTRNNFDLLRLLFAATVCLVHAYDLSGYPQLAWLARVLSPASALKGFFVVSGFLVFMSFERSSSLASYARKRIRRIYPAYFTVVMLCAVALPAVGSQGVGGYFSLDWGKYVLANLFFLNFLQPGLPGVFESNPLAAVNGALWTLKIEVMFYLMVPFFVFLFRRFARLPVLVLTYGLSLAYVALLTAAAERTGSGIYLELARQLPGQLSYFMAGAFLYYFLPLFERRPVCFLLAAALVLAVDTIVPLPLLEPLALATVVVFFALFLYVGNFAKYGDFSYGVYIIHFPVIQLLVQGGWLRDRPGWFLATLILLTGMGALAMWHLVEKRFLLRSSHYLAGESLAAAATDLASDQSTPFR